LYDLFCGNLYVGGFEFLGGSVYDAVFFVCGMDCGVDKLFVEGFRDLFVGDTGFISESKSAIEFLFGFFVR